MPASFFGPGILELLAGYFRTGADHPSLFNYGTMICSFFPFHPPLSYFFIFIFPFFPSQIRHWSHFSTVPFTKSLLFAFLGVALGLFLTGAKPREAGWVSEDEP